MFRRFAVSRQMYPGQLARWMTVGLLSLLLPAFISLLSVLGTRLSAYAAPTLADEAAADFGKVNAPSFDPSLTGTIQNFDSPGTGTPYVAGIHVAPITSTQGPQLINGGPTNNGQFMRLAFAASPIPTHNSLAFTRTNAGAFNQIVADFDFRMTPGNGQADGFGFAFLNTTNYGLTGTVAPQSPLYSAEEPNFANSLGIGFDIYQSNPPPEMNNNHLSVHFNGALIQEFNASSVVALASGQWIHARIIMRPGGGYSDVTVSLTACGHSASTLINHFQVSGFTPYEGRVYFAARAGGQSADHDLDNVQVQFLSLTQSIPTFSNRCYSLVENDFDLPETGTPYSLGIHANPLTPTLIAGGPTDSGEMLRLAFGNTAINHNSLTFDRADPGEFDQIVADFDFRITPGTGRADGFGFALLKTGTYGLTGTVAPLAVAEEPNFVESLGIGFDIYHSPTEINDNHVSVHFNGALVSEFDASSAVDLAGSQWIHARLILRPGGGYSDVSVILTQCGRPASIVIDHFHVNGFTPSEGRVHFAARSGGLLANHDLDNVRVQFLSLEQSLLAFSTGCYSVVETNGPRALIVTRQGDLNESVAVSYTTTNLSATSPTDYTGISGTLTFAAGEISKTLSVPIQDDSDTEPDESFRVSLSNATGSALVGGPAVAKVTIIDDETARQKGHWSEVIPAQVVPIQMHLLPTGQVMYWDRYSEDDVWDGNPHLWNPLTEMITATTVLTYDIFCSGHAFIADGRLLVTGGHIANGVGEDEASLYDPFTNSWTRLPVMNAGRWYPSNVILANGEALVLGGTYAQPITSTPTVNTLPQVWQAANSTWRNLTTAQIGNYPDYADYYPFLYLAPNGKVFNAGPQSVARYLDTSGTGLWTDVATSTLPYRDYGSSVMYADGKVLIVGGNLRGDIFVPEASAEVINVNEASPVWHSVDPMHFGRRHLNTTLLPDGQVLVTGGSAALGFDNPSGAVLAAEMWNPGTETWTVMAAQTRYRGYHSTALLLPDGRVLVGGGGHPNPASGAESNFEIYSPPYLFKGTRPAISQAPAQASYGQSFFIQTPNALTITQVSLIRLSSVTHAFNQNQRFKQLAMVQAPGGLTATVPADPNLLPPGHYMLFILNSDGVPSVARILRIGSNNAPSAGPDTATTSEDTPKTLNVLANDTDANNDPLTVVTVTQPTTGTATTNGTLVFYTPTLNFNGPALFTYTVSDGALTSTARVTVTINPINDAPVALNDSYFVNRTTPLNVSATAGVLGNDSDIESSPLTATLVTAPNTGLLTLKANGAFIYTPTLNLSSVVTFTYRATDGISNSNTALVTLTPVFVYLPLVMRNWSDPNPMGEIHGGRFW